MTEIELTENVLLSASWIYWLVRYNVNEHELEVCSDGD